VSRKDRPSHRPRRAARTPRRAEPAPAGRPRARSARVPRRPPRPHRSAGSSDPAPVHVAAAVLTNPRAEVLLCQRPPGGRFGLKWEFPGGKVEPGETARAALVRELREELGIDSRPGTLLLRLEHRYDGGPHVLLDFFQVRTYHGTPRNLAFHDIRWVVARALPDFDLLEADLFLIRLLVK